MRTAADHRADLARDMLERDLQAKVLRIARDLGYELTYHTHDSRRSNPGFPDLVLLSLRRGRVLYRELKTERGRVSPDQQRWLVALREVGCDAGVWRPTDLLDGTVVRELTGSTP